MKKILLLFALLLCTAMPAAAQFDLVTGQVVDPSNLPYSSATVRAQLVKNGVVLTGQPTVANANQAQCISAGLGNAPCQMPFPGTQSFTLDGNGNIPGGGINLADNPSVTPAGTQWLFTITLSPGIAPPAGSGPQSFSVAITVSSNPQAIGATLSAAAPKLTNISSSIASKNSGLFGSNVIYPNAPPFNISMYGKSCIGVEASWPNTSTTVNCNSGTQFIAGSVVLNANVVTITFLQSNPFNPVTANWQAGQNITVAGLTGVDAFFNNTYTISTVTSNTVTFPLVHANQTSTTPGQVTNTVVGPFIPTDTGTLGFGTPCATGILNCVGASATRPLGTVTYVSATQVSVAGNSTAACVAPGCQFWLFTDDRAKWGPGSVVGTVDWAVQNAQGCISVVVPAGVTAIPFGQFNASNPTCGQATSPAFGNLLSTTDVGNSVWGQGMGATIFLLPPDSNFANCAAPSLICLWAGISAGGNFTITGGGNGIPAGGAHNVVIWQPNQNASFFDNISLTTFGSGDTGNLVGAEFTFTNKYEGIYVDQFGSFPCFFSGVNVILSYYSCGNSRQIPMTMTGSGTIVHTNNGYQQATNGTIGVDVGAGGSGVTWYSVQDQSYGAINGGGTHVYVEPGSIAHVEQWTNTGGSNFGFQLGNTAKLYLRDSFVNGLVHSIGTNGVALTTGGFFDELGNTYNGTAIESTLVPTCSSTGLTQTACTLVAGSTNEKGTIRVSAGGGGGAFTETLTFAGTFSGASATTPACNFMYANTGSASWTVTAGLTISTRATTSMVIAGTATTVNGQTYDVDYVCVAR